MAPFSRTKGTEVSCIPHRFEHYFLCVGQMEEGPTLLYCITCWSKRVKGNSFLLWTDRWAGAAGYPSRLVFFWSSGIPPFTPFDALWFVTGLIMSLLVYFPSTDRQAGGSGGRVPPIRKREVSRTPSVILIYVVAITDSLRMAFGVRSPSTIDAIVSSVPQ